MDTIILDSQLTIFLQLLLAMALGMLLGAERSFAGKAAGMRTYALISMGSALFVVISNSITPVLILLTDVDPLRVMAGLITGVGFIGAGIILFRESTLRGLTAAA